MKDPPERATVDFTCCSQTVLPERRARGFKKVVMTTGNGYGRAVPRHLAIPVTERDHTQGQWDAPVILVEYGDYECPLCGGAFHSQRDSEVFRRAQSALRLSPLPTHGVTPARNASGDGSRGRRSATEVLEDARLAIRERAQSRQRTSRRVRGATRI